MNTIVIAGVGAGLLLGGLTFLAVQNARLGACLRAVILMLKEILKMDQAVKDLLDQMNQETNAIAAKLDAEVAAIAKANADRDAAIAAAIAAGQALPPTDPALLAGLTALRDRLKVIAADPADPVPAPAPVTPPAAPAPVVDPAPVDPAAPTPPTDPVQ